MFRNAMVSFNIFFFFFFIMVPPDGDDDDDGNLYICDERLSFNFKCDDDDNVNRHIKNDAVMTI